MKTGKLKRDEEEKVDGRMTAVTSNDVGAAKKVMVFAVVAAITVGCMNDDDCDTDTDDNNDGSSSLDDEERGSRAELLATTFKDNEVKLLVV